MKVFGTILALSLALSAPSNAHAASARTEFTNLWNTRISSYQGEHYRAEIESQRAASDAKLAVERKDSDLVPPLHAALRAFQRQAYLNARFELLKGFIAMFKEKPSRELARSWLIERANEAASIGRQANADAEQIREMKAGENGKSVADLFAAQVNMVGHYGVANGLNDELLLLVDNVGQYYSARDREEENGRRTAGFLAAFSASLLAQSAQAQQSWSATCTSFGIMTRCSGN